MVNRLHNTKLVHYAEQVNRCQDEAQGISSKTVRDMICLNGSEDRDRHEMEMEMAVVSQEQL